MTTDIQNKIHELDEQVTQLGTDIVETLTTADGDLRELEKGVDETLNSLEKDFAALDTLAQEADDDMNIALMQYAESLAEGEQK